MLDDAKAWQGVVLSRDEQRVFGEAARLLVLPGGRQMRHPQLGDWYNNRCLFESIGNRPPAEAEARYYAAQQEIALAA